MQIKYHKKFNKKFYKFTPKLRKKIRNIIELFKENPHNPILKNHALKGRLKGQRAFSATGDIRIIFKKTNDYVIVIMLDVGIHNQVY